MIAALRAREGHGLILISEGPPASAGPWGGDGRIAKTDTEVQLRDRCGCSVMTGIEEVVRRYYLRPYFEVRVNRIC